MGASAFGGGAKGGFSEQGKPEALGCLKGRGHGGPRTRDARSSGLSASVLPAAADSWVDLGCIGWVLGAS